MSRSFKIAGFIAGLMAVLALNGGHWLALQSVAWARMIMDFSQCDPLGTALAKTFSGDHPCPMCLKIRHGWQQERQQERKPAWVKTEALPECVWAWRCLMAPPAPAASAEEAAFVPVLYADFIESPPTPPPRAAMAVL